MIQTQHFYAMAVTSSSYGASNVTYWAGDAVVAALPAFFLLGYFLGVQKQGENPRSFHTLRAVFFDLGFNTREESDENTDAERISRHSYPNFKTQLILFRLGFSPSQKSNEKASCSASFKPWIR